MIRVATDPPVRPFYKGFFPVWPYGLYPFPHRLSQLTVLFPYHCPRELSFFFFLLFFPDHFQLSDVPPLFFSILETIFFFFLLGLFTLTCWRAGRWRFFWFSVIPGLISLRKRDTPFSCFQISSALSGFVSLSLFLSLLAVLFSSLKVNCFPLTPLEFLLSPGFTSHLFSTRAFEPEGFALIIYFFFFFFPVHPGRFPLKAVQSGLYSICFFSFFQPGSAQLPDKCDFFVFHSPLHPSVRYFSPSPLPATLLRPFFPYRRSGLDSLPPSLLLPFFLPNRCAFVLPYLFGIKFFLLASTPYTPVLRVFFTVFWIFWVPGAWGGTHLRHPLTCFFPFIRLDFTPTPRTFLRSLTPFFSCSVFSKIVPFPLLLTLAVFPIPWPHRPPLPSFVGSPTIPFFFPPPFPGIVSQTLPLPRVCHDELREPELFSTLFRFCLESSPLIYSWFNAVFPPCCVNEDKPSFFLMGPCSFKSPSCFPIWFCVSLD